MNLSKEQLEYHKKVGKLNGKDLFEVATKGGLHLIIAPKGSGFETLGAGPHRAVARFIAQKSQPDIQYTELSKGDHVDVSDFIEYVPKYETVTQRLRAINGDD